MSEKQKGKQRAVSPPSPSIYGAFSDSSPERLGSPGPGSSPRTPPHVSSPAYNPSALAPPPTPGTAVAAQLGQMQLSSNVEAVENRGTAIAEYVQHHLPFANMTLAGWLRDFAERTVTEQRAMADELMSHLNESYDRMIYLIVAAGAFFEQKSELMSQYGGQEAFREQYPVLKVARDNAARKLKELENAIRSIKSINRDFYEDHLMKLTPQVLQSHQGATDVRYLLNRAAPDELAPFLNTALIRRLANPRRAQDRFINITDWAVVKGYFSQLPHRISAALSNKDASEWHQGIRACIEKHTRNRSGAMQILRDGQFRTFGDPTPNCKPAMWKELVAISRNYDTDKDNNKMAMYITKEGTTQNGMILLRTFLVPQTKLTQALAANAKPRVVAREEQEQRVIAEGISRLVLSTLGVDLLYGGQALEEGAGGYHLSEQQ
ncbi:hypothetical protein NX059_012164 [Plenodomus lindquistii]|nr:hypothetical protein NX059_012164 [Plenodomus lindquistii]